MPLPLIAAGIGLVGGAVQSLIGAGQANRANKQLNNLFKQRKPYSTPNEIFEILQMQENNAQTGFGSETMNFLEGQADRGLSASLGTAQRLGGDPNAISGVLDSYFQDIFKIGSENELLKMKKFDSLINATNLLAENKTAEWQSQENLIKDQMQAQAQKVAAGQQNIQSGLNLALGGLSSLATNSLYGNNNSADGTVSNGSTTTSTGGTNAGQVPLTPSQQRRIQEIINNP